MTEDPKSPGAGEEEVGGQNPDDEEDLIPADHQIHSEDSEDDILQGEADGTDPDDDEEIIPPDYFLRPPVVSEEQLLYAKILERGMFLGLALLLVTFALYASGLLSPGVPIERLPDYWVMSVHEYLEAIEHNHLHQDHLITGWAWLTILTKSDFLNFLPIAILSAVTIVCYVGIIPTLLRKKDIAYAIMAIVEVVILALAASGILSVGH